jgi:glycosyltransferase involved in cell wall biosynthesis
VVTRSGGPEDYVEDGRNGFVVPVEDPAAMADRVGTILRAPPERWAEMSAASRAIAERFDWDRSAEQLEALFVGLLARRRVRG